LSDPRELEERFFAGVAQKPDASVRKTKTHFLLNEKLGACVELMMEEDEAESLKEIDVEILTGRYSLFHYHNFFQDE